MKIKKRKLPDDTNEVEYGWENANEDTRRVITNLLYDCGCEYKVIWVNIESGKVHSITIEDICEAHDPTIPYVKDGNDE